MRLLRNWPPLTTTSVGAHVMADLTQSQNLCARKPLTHERLLEVLHYDPETGIFTWKVRTSNRVRVGAIAGTPTTRGYHEIHIDGVRYPAHQLAWFYFYGEWPTYLVDHESNIGTQNWIKNLRPANKSQNNANSKGHSRTGFKGVALHRPGRWVAQIQKDGRNIYLGIFRSPELAHEAYVAKAKELFGSFARAS